MKTKFRFLAIFLVLLLAFSGCKSSTTPEVTPENQPPAEEVVDPVQAEIDEFFTKYVNTDERPIAVMIDNDDKNARPQIGINDAYLIYEMIVEGGATRFMAVYRDADTEKIGPIRSSRHYFLDYMKEHDAIYVHCGWSDRAGAEITSQGINKINGILGEDGDAFWREDKFKGDWHSTYTNMERINTKSQKKGFKAETKHKSGINYSDSYINLPAENVANKIHMQYSYVYSTGYTYNAETQLYEKSIGSQPHLMQDGNVVAVKNILVQFIGDSSLGDGTPRRELITTGSGKGYYFTNGAYEEITWSKESRGANTIYKKADGTELKINPGKTFINIISPSSEFTIE